MVRAPAHPALAHHPFWWSPKKLGNLYFVIIGEKYNPMDNDIQAFANSIGAVGLSTVPKLRSLFKILNYFFLSGNIIVVKISHIVKPFWSVKRDIIENISNAEGIGYYLVLFASPNEGFVFVKNEVKYFIMSEKWNLFCNDNYKVNWPLPNSNGFTTPKQAVSPIEGQ